MRFASRQGAPADQSLPIAAQTLPSVKIAPLWVLTPPVAANMARSASAPRFRRSVKQTSGASEKCRTPMRKQSPQ